MDNYETYVKPLIERLDKLKELGFASYQEIKVKGGRDILHCWERVLPWKKDIVQMTRPKDNPHSCRVDLFVYLIVDVKNVILAGTSVSNLKHKQSDYPFPGLFKNFRASSIIDSVASDVLSSLDWFKGFDDKKACLTRIKEARPEDNIMRTDAPIFPAVEKLLST